MKLKNILKGWEQPTGPKRWSGAEHGKDGLTEFERMGGKDPIGEGRGDESYKIALDLVGLNARNKVFKKHKVGKYDSDLSYDVIQDAIEILKRLL